MSKKPWKTTADDGAQFKYMNKIQLYTMKAALGPLSPVLVQYTEQRRRKKPQAHHHIKFHFNFTLKSFLPSVGPSLFI